MARGDFSQRITATSHDEIGTLARSFNQMAAELAETDRLRRDLVANVSHELRTPITALQAVLENLVDGVGRARPRDLRTMLAQVERLGPAGAAAARPLAPRVGGAAARPRGSSRSSRCSTTRCASRGCTPGRRHARRSRSSPARSRSRPTRSACTRSSPTSSRTRCAIRRATGGCSCARPRRPDGARTRGDRRRSGHPRRRGARACSSASTAPTPRARRATAAPGSASRSRSGSSICTAATSAPSATSRTAAGWSCAFPVARRRPSRDPRRRQRRVPVHQRKRVTVSLTPIDDALRRIRRGEMVLVVDDEDRENEGDLTMAAEWVTRRGGQLHVALGARARVHAVPTATWLDKLDIGPMVPPGQARLRHRVHGHDRPPQRGLRHRRGRPRAHDPARPRPGVAARATSSGPGTCSRCARATVVCSSAAVTPRPRSTSRGSRGSPPVAVICEVLHDDGSPARLPYLELFAQEHRIAMISVEQVAEHRARRRRHRDRRARAAPALIGHSLGDWRGGARVTAVP